MSSRPNVLFMMTDHTNAEALAPGGQCLTPNLDALAREGCRMARCHTANGICSPARASLMTGTYASTHGVWDCTHTQRREWVDLHGHLTHWAERLAEAGYKNAYYGKWHVEQSCDLSAFGWPEYDDQCGKPRPALEPIEGTELYVKTPGYPDKYILGVAENSPRAVTHAAADKAVEFIHAQAGSDQPFCCVVSAAEPHDPYVPAQKFFDMYDLDGIALPETLHSELAGKPELLKRMQAVWKDLSEDDWRKIRACYWAVITFLDSQFGKLVSALKETNCYDNTIIIFSADHGDMMGAHGMMTKGIGLAYEQVYNIPLVMKAPGQALRGEVKDALVGLIDVGPTLLDLCGADTLGDQCQGRSFRSLLEGKTTADDWQDAYAEFFGQRFLYTQRIVWHKYWKFIFNPGGIDELYNLDDDPWETINLAGDPRYQDKLIEMTRRMWRKMKAIDDTSLLHTPYGTLRTAVVGPLEL
ncbi:MAG: sulfatase-like hydrolase/transferase [Planctomycetes bacterium]|nr:sulfatase-like hydrolase/transferase [Planctomycetota bacterium]